jgi:hypothetical protein
MYNKKIKGPTLMELFTTAGKFKRGFMTTREVRCVHRGWHCTHWTSLVVKKNFAFLYMNSGSLKCNFRFVEPEGYLYGSNPVLFITEFTTLTRGTRWLSGWGTALQTGRSRDRFPMVSLEFFIDIILRPHYGPGVESASNKNEYQEYFLGVKAAGA